MFPAAQDPIFQTENISSNMQFGTVWRWAWFYYFIMTQPQRWVDCHIFRSRSSPDFWKLSPSPTAVQKIFQIKSPSPDEVQNIWKMQLFYSKNAAFLFHQLSPISVRIVNFEVIYSPGPIQIQKNLL